MRSLFEGVRSVGEVLDQAACFLGQQNCPNAELDAGVLLAHVLGCDRVRLAADPSRSLSKEQSERFEKLLGRRARSEPVAYLTGSKEFWSLPIQVDPRVLIPRPDTETLLEEAAELFDKVPPERFLDLGTGSGCLACALARMFPQSRGWAIDRDADALEVARQNLYRHGVDERVWLVHAQGLEPVPREGVELICANLPYISTRELMHLSDDIRLYEPLSALDGGFDGLQHIRMLVHQAPNKLTPKGYLLMEVGDRQASVVADLCLRANLTEVHTRKDLAGIDRVVVAKRPGV